MQRLITNFRKPFLLAMLLGVLSASYAQHNNEFYNNGDLIHVQAGAEMHVMGDVYMQGGTLENDGLILTQGNSYSDNTFQQRGTGTYRIENSMVNVGERQFIQGSYAVRGGQTQIGIDDGSFYNLELNNDQGLVYLMGGGEVADVRNSVDFMPGGLSNTLVTHDIGTTGPVVFPANGSGYSSTFGMMNTAPGLGNLINNTVSVNGNISNIDSGYIQGNLRRAIDPAGGTYGYVVGLEPAGAGMQRGIQYVHINFNANTYDVVRVFFESASSNVIVGPNIDCGGYLFDYYGGADHGEWFFDDVTGAGSGEYEMQVWPQDDNYPLSVVWLITKEDAIQGTMNQCGPTPVGLTRAGFDGFSPSDFDVASATVILPANGLNIRTKVSDSYIQVLWEAVLNEQVEYFVLERAEGSGEFTPLSVHNAEAIFIQNSEQVYADFQVELNQIYQYRVQAVDKNGEFQYSKVVQASILTHLFPNTEIELYPNPADVSFQIKIEVKEGSTGGIKVVNSLGQSIWEEEMVWVEGVNLINLKTQHWASGIYHLEILDDKTGWRSMKKLLIQH